MAVFNDDKIQVIKETNSNWGVLREKTEGTAHAKTLRTEEMKGFVSAHMSGSHTQPITERGQGRET